MQNSSTSSKLRYYNEKSHTVETMWDLKYMIVRLLTSLDSSLSSSEACDRNSEWRA